MSHQYVDLLQRLEAALGFLPYTPDETQGYDVREARALSRVAFLRGHREGVAEATERFRRMPKGEAT